MTDRDPLEDLTEVAVYTDDGRSSDLATFHGWDRRGDEWWAHLMVYGPRDPNSGSGMYRDTVHSDRLVPMVYCGRLPSGEIRHSCEGRVRMSTEDQVWT